MDLIFSEKKSFASKAEMRMGNGLFAAIPCRLPSVNVGSEMPRVKKKRGGPALG
jgi:hypothetical protein